VGATPGILGNAQLASTAEINAAGLFGAAGIRLGMDRATGAVIRYNGDAHLITVAPTRSGKGRDVLIPALLEYRGSCIVIDPKGQLAAVTAAQRARMGQRVVILNPFGILPQDLGRSAKFNPMASLDPGSDGFGADCDSLADAIVYHEGGHSDNASHFTDSARQLLSGMIMYLASNLPESMRNLAALRRLICSPAVSKFASEAVSANDTFIGERLSRFASADAENKEVLSIISTAITQTGFIGNKAIADNLSGSDFRFRDLKYKPTTVYLVLPTRYLATCGKWFRLIVAAALDDLLREERGIPILAMLDEFAQLGRLAAIENAMGLAAGYGVQLWPVLQDLTRLKELYGESWETFLSNTGIRQFFAPRDKTTSDYLSDLCGHTTIYVSGQSRTSSGLLHQSVGSSWGEQGRPFFYPHEVRQVGRERFLMFAEHVDNVILGARRPYWAVPEFQGRFSPDPYHQTTATPPPLPVGN
jgi:type IV secretion system protein VirD4